MSKPDPEKLFWQIAEGMYADPAVQKGTIMGFSCLRVEGAFFASLERNSQALILKLPQERIASLLEEGRGERFAPAGRVFKEWIKVTEPDGALWRRLMQEAKAFVASS